MKTTDTIIQFFLFQQVLEEGSIVEFDEPYLLLQKSDGVLRKLVDQTGKTETMHLVDIAKTAFQKLHDNEVLDSVEDYVKSTSLHDIPLAIDETGEDQFNKMNQGSEDHIGDEEVADVSRVDNGEDLSEDNSMNNSVDSEVNEYTLTDIEDATIRSETDEITELLERKSKEPENDETETQLELDEDTGDHDEMSKLLMRDERVNDST